MLDDIKNTPTPKYFGIDYTDGTTAKLDDVTITLTAIKQIAMRQADKNYKAIKKITYLKDKHSREVIQEVITALEKAEDIIPIIIEL